MSEISNFESRPGKVSCNAEELFAFVTDIRNFERFVPQGTINDWNAEKESCSFNVSMIGAVNVRINKKEMFNKVVYTGDALMVNDFSIVLDILANEKKPVEVKVSLSADLNPMLKMMAEKPINLFLGKLIAEIEDFRDWKDIKE